MRDKRLQSIGLILILAIAGIAGLMLVMQMTAASVDTADNSNTADEVITTTATSNREPTEDDIIAMINDQPITKEAWQKATRLDAVMNRLARQPIATAEETLDRLINEIIVLDAAPPQAEPGPAEIETRTLALAQSWNVTDEAITSALEEEGLTRDNLLERVSRLIQVEQALNQLAAQEPDLNAWLADARASAEIGLYHSLVDTPVSQTIPTTQTIAQITGTSITTDSDLALTAAETLAPPADMPVAPYVNNAAPDFTLPQLEGAPLTLSDFRGKPTIVNFWASWCPPCRRELPALQTAYQKYSDQIGFIAVDVKENPDTVANFVADLNLTFPLVVDQNGQVSDISYEVRGIPTTIFVDAYGVVSARHVGPLDETTIDGYLKPLLEQAEQLATTGVPDEGDPAINLINTDSLDTILPDNNNQSESQPVKPLDNSNLAPIFTLPSGTGETVSLEDYRDQSNVVLVFYRGHT